MVRRLVENESSSALGTRSAQRQIDCVPISPKCTVAWEPVASVANVEPFLVATTWHLRRQSCLYSWTLPFVGVALNCVGHVHAEPHLCSCRLWCIFAGDKRGIDSDGFCRRRIFLRFLLCTHNCAIVEWNAWKIRRIRHTRKSHNACPNCDRCTLCTAHRREFDLRGMKMIWYVIK